MIDLKFVYLSKVNWSVVGNLVESNYHVTQAGKEVLQVQPTILSQGHPGLELSFSNLDDGPMSTLLAIFLDKYIKLPTLAPKTDLDNLGLKSKMPYLNNFNK
ncbi:hypothetical protein NBRC111452_1874 [Companilactobacillus farciminis]|nr:hypothetical protein NBRC111452_1874 [Companilactobacillus farciminis]